MKWIAPIVEFVLALVGLFSVLAMGGGWGLVTVVAIGAAATVWRIRRRRAGDAGERLDG